MGFLLAAPGGQVQTASPPRSAQMRGRGQLVQRFTKGGRLFCWLLSARLMKGALPGQTFILGRKWSLTIAEGVGAFRRSTQTSQTLPFLLVNIFQEIIIQLIGNLFHSFAGTV